MPIQIFNDLWGVSRTKSVELMNLKKSCHAQNEQDLAEVSISIPQRPGSGASWEAL